MKQEFSPLHLYTSFRESQRSRNYTEMGFDYKAYEQLKEELDAMQVGVDPSHSVSS